MEIIKSFFIVIEIILFVYFGFAALYIFIFALAGRIGYSTKNTKIHLIRKIAVLIPGYKEDNVIVEVAQDALNQDYPKGQFEIIVIADSFKPETINSLNSLPIRLIEVQFEKSTKSKALNTAMAEIGDDYEIALILDADNIMEIKFLQKINNAFNQGFTTVQAHRIAKNLNTNMAILDAISEEVNNHIYRLGHRALGFSSALIGSGMAFDYAFFKKTMKEIDAVGGFDKELELRLLQGGHKIEYLESALVYDEKVQNREVFQNQRKRWLSAQFVYFGRYFLPGLKDLFLKANIDFFDKVYQMIQPPRILQLGTVSIITLIVGIINLTKIPFLTEFNSLNPNYWYSAFILTIFAFFLSIPAKFYNKKTLKAIIALPGSFISMFSSLFKLKGANKKFIHTQHGTNH